MTSFGTTNDSDSEWNSDMEILNEIAAPQEEQIADANVVDENGHTSSELTREELINILSSNEYKINNKDNNPLSCENRLIVTSAKGK